MKLSLLKKTKKLKNWKFFLLINIASSNCFFGIRETEWQKRSGDKYAIFPPNNLQNKAGTFKPNIENFGKKRIGFFLGSSIGNFYDKKEKIFLQNARATLGKNGCLFVGVDLIKNKKIIEKAYNDSKGTTAKFNFNLLSRINKVFKTKLKQKDFKYFSHFNKKNNSVESFLISKKDQKFIIDNKKFFVKKNEKIQTEISKKFTLNSFKILANSAGWKVKKYWTDKNKYYSVFLLEN